MRAYEFRTRVTEAGDLELPTSLLESLSAGQTVRVLILVEEPPYDADQMSEEEEDAAWERFATEQFLRQYNEDDAIYDRL